jgi:DNA-binding beta-propeller fold protein YncE
VANGASNNVTKLNQNGKTLGTFTVGNGPLGLAYDGANIWVTNSGDSTVAKVRATDGAILGTFAVGINPWGVVFDGANIWVANYSDNTISKL